MARWFNIGGPCNPATNYMLSAMERLPEVASLVRKVQYFVVHAPRQCGKTTAFLSFANETNAKGDAVAMYCSLETVQEFPKAADGIPKICACLREAAWGLAGIDLGVHFRGAVYAVEVKTRKLYEKSREKAYAQVAKYIDRLGLSEGWLVVVDADFSKPWEGKVSSEDLEQDGKAIHVVCC